MTSIRFSLARRALLMTAGFALAASAAAQGYPAKPIHLIVPASAGTVGEAGIELQ